MYSSPEVATVTTISSLRFLPSGAARLVLKSLATSSAASRGRWPMAAKTRLMETASLGARNHPEMIQHRPTNATWKLITFRPFCCSAST